MLDTVSLRRCYFLAARISNPRFHGLVGAREDFSTSPAKNFRPSPFASLHVDSAIREPTYGWRFKNDQRRISS